MYRKKTLKAMPVHTRRLAETLQYFNRGVTFLHKLIPVIEDMERELAAATKTIELRNAQDKPLDYRCQDCGAVCHLEKLSDILTSPCASCQYLPIISVDEIFAVE